ncbi:alpha-ketoacid dehydrogenase subunit beta [bacterium]|nr:alpha-ketoacid dehydrogenase subunit beta [bacterium]
MKVIEEINSVLHEIMHASDDVFILGEDIVDPYGGAFKVTKGLSTVFPDRVISTPISEAGFVGMGIGMSCKGLLPVVEIMFGDFIALAFDQIVNNASKIEFMSNGKMLVPLTIRTPMGAGRGYGATHSQSLEKHFIGVPGIKIIAVSSVIDIKEIYRNAVLKDKSPTILVENKLLYSMQVKRQGMGETFDKFIIESKYCSGYPHVCLRLTDQKSIDFTIVAYGGVLESVIPAVYSILIEDEISCEIIVPSLIYPFDEKIIENSIKNSGALVVVEEGTKSGGFSDYISSLVNREFYSFIKSPTLVIAPEDSPVPCSREQEGQYLPDIVKIREMIVKSYKVRGAI